MTMKFACAYFLSERKQRPLRWMLVSLVLHCAWPFTLAYAAAATRDPCMGSATDSALLACRTTAYKRSLARVEAIEAKLTASYGKDIARVQALVDAQVAWRAFRETDCKLRTFDSAGGSAYEVYRLDCWAMMNERRAEQLNSLARAP